MKKSSVREKRRKQLLGPGAYVSSTWFLLGLVQAARLLLIAARDERKKRDNENYLTQNGPAAIVVAVTALECFVNQAIQQFFVLPNRADFEKLLAKDSLKEKLGQIPPLAGGGVLVTTNIEMVQHVRDEIVHHHPRDVGGTNVPEWLEPLAKGGCYLRWARVQRI